MSQKSFEEFQQQVRRNPTLQRQLTGVMAPERFMQLLVQLGREHGYSFTVDDVKTKLTAAADQLIERSPIMSG